MTDDLPPDVDPDSRCRLPMPRREDLDEAGRRIYDHHLDPAGGSLAGLQGPGGIRLHSPGITANGRGINRYLRFEAGFDPAIRELIILVTAREMDSQFEWTAHEPEAEKEGLGRDVIEAVKHDRPVDGLPATEATVIRLGRELFRDHRLSSQTYARALDIFGARQLVDLVSLMGGYAGTALLLAAFDMQLPPGRTPPLPDR